jgi:hypothetical protein
MKMKPLSLLVIALILISCVPTTSLPSTSMPTFTQTMTSPPVQETQTITPHPPTPTYTPTPIPTIDYGYSAVMQVATFDLWLQYQYPEESLAISKIVFRNSEDGILGAIESSVKILDSKDYAEINGVGWSPGGEYFAYAVGINNSALRSWCINLCEGIELWITSHDGSYKKMLSSESTRLSHKRISWHPDESKFITFCSTDDSELSYNLEICIVQVPSGEIERTGNFGVIAQYSPIGDSYLYYDSNGDFYLVSESSPQPVKILSPKIYFSVSEKSNFVWSPDGMYFYSNQIIGNSKNALYKISLDGMFEKLTNMRNNHYLIHSISPNGFYLLMCDFSLFDPFDDCEVYDIASATSTNIPSSKDYIAPMWTPNSNLLVKGDVLNYSNGSTTDFKMLFDLSDNKRWSFDIFTFTSKLPEQ